MSSFADWLAREARRQTRRTDLAAALMSGSGVAYARRRLGPMWLRSWLRFLLHAYEIFLLCDALPSDYLAPLLAYRALAQLASTAHWGALEPLRRQVRELAGTRHTRALSAAIERWLRVGVGLGALPALVFAVRMASGAFDPHTGMSLFDTYAFACFARAACEVYTRIYHAGIFALRRVYRPLFSLVASDLLELLLIMVSFDALGPWCIPIAIVASGALDAGFTLHYARAAYRLQRIDPPRAMRLRRALASSQERRSAWIAPTLAHATTQLDGLLLVLLLRTDPPRAGAASLALAYYVLRPVLGLATQWVRTFYFDLSRLERGALQVFRGHLARYLRRIGVACAALVALTSVFLARWAWPRLDPRELAWLVPLVFARALFAQRQLEAFVRGRYLRLLMVAVPLWLLLVAGTAYGLDSVNLLKLASAALLLGYACLPAALEAQYTVDSQVGLGAWLSAVGSAEAVQLAVVEVARAHAGSARTARVAEGLQSPGRMLARCGRTHLFIAETSAHELQRAALVAASGGALSALWLSARTTGFAGLSAARARGVLPDALAHALAAPPLTAAALRREFVAGFAGGRVIDFRSHAGDVARLGLSRSQLSELTAQIILAASQREYTRRNRLPVQIAVYAPGGEAQLVFVAPRTAATFAAFRARVRAATLQSSWPGAHGDHSTGITSTMRRRNVDAMHS